MSNESPDRQRTRQDLQELARQARATPPSSFKTSDSAGFVDLSAFSATDASWVDRELARTAAGSPPASSGKSNAINSLSAQSMVPVALSALLTLPPGLAPEPRRRRPWIVVAGLAAVLGVGALAVIVARSAPSAKPVTTSVAVADTDPAATTPPVAAADEPPADTMAAAPPPIAQPTTTLTAPATGASGKKARVGPSHATAVVAVAAQHSARPVPVPRSKSSSSSGGGDSLMDAMRASVKPK